MEHFLLIMWLICLCIGLAVWLYFSQREVERLRRNLTKPEELKELEIVADMDWYNLDAYIAYKLKLAEIENRPRYHVPERPMYKTEITTSPKEDKE